jgi:hypothetical protein
MVPTGRVSKRRSEQRTPGRRRTRKRYGDLVPLAAQIADRSEWTIYAVLEGKYRSMHCERAIEIARAEMRELRQIA